MNNINNEILLQNIESLSKSKGVSMTTAFVESGVGKNFKSNLNYANPSIGKITMLANYFGVSVDYLLGKEEKHSEPEVLPDKNVIKILGRDGRRIEKHLTDEQMQALQVLIDQLPDAPDDL